MNERTPFNPLQAQEVAEAFNAVGVDYLFIGKSGAILLGYPGTTQDVDVFPAKSAANGERSLHLSIVTTKTDATDSNVIIEYCR